jgi:hypothetical protein
VKSYWQTCKFAQHIYMHTWQTRPSICTTHKHAYMAYLQLSICTTHAHGHTCKQSICAINILEHTNKQSIRTTHAHGHISNQVFAHHIYLSTLATKYSHNSFEKKVYLRKLWLKGFRSTHYGDQTSTRCTNAENALIAARRTASLLSSSLYNGK